MTNFRPAPPASTRPICSQLIVHADGRRAGLARLIISRPADASPESFEPATVREMVELIIPSQPRCGTAIGVESLPDGLEFSFYLTDVMALSQGASSAVLVLNEAVFGCAALSVPIEFAVDSESRSPVPDVVELEANRELQRQETQKPERVPALQRAVSVIAESAMFAGGVGVVLATIL